MAYSVPESGAFTLFVDLQAVELDDHETLDVIGVTSTQWGATSEAGNTAAVPITHRVMFGRRFAGIVEESVLCGYSEDQDPSSVQESPGVGCRFRYANPGTSDALNGRQEDWVNAAATVDARPLFGKRAAAAAAVKDRLK